MRRTFFELITQFTEQNGCSCELKEGECQASFNAEGLKVHLGLLESSGMLLELKDGTSVSWQPKDRIEAGDFAPASIAIRENPHGYRRSNGTDAMHKLWRSSFTG